MDIMNKTYTMCIDERAVEDDESGMALSLVSVDLDGFVRTYGVSGEDACEVCDALIGEPKYIDGVAVYQVEVELDDDDREDSCISIYQKQPSGYSKHVRDFVGEDAFIIYEAINDVKRHRRLTVHLKSML